MDTESLAGETEVAEPDAVDEGDVCTMVDETEDEPLRLPDVYSWGLEPEADEDPEEEEEILEASPEVVIQVVQVSPTEVTIQVVPVGAAHEAEAARELAPEPAELDPAYSQALASTEVYELPKMEIDPARVKFEMIAVPPTMDYPWALRTRPRSSADIRFDT